MSLSGSVAATAAPTLAPALEFSAMLRVALSGSFGSALRRLPLSDHALAPSAFVARTCTS